MNVKLKSIVVSYSLHDETFHRETLLEYTQGNALRILKGHAVRFHAFAMVETEEQAERAVANFRRQLLVARGMEVPLFARRQAAPVPAVS